MLGSAFTPSWLPRSWSWSRVVSNFTNLMSECSSCSTSDHNQVCGAARTGAQIHDCCWATNEGPLKCGRHFVFQPCECLSCLHREQVDDGIKCGILARPDDQCKDDRFRPQESNQWDFRATCTSVFCKVLMHPMRFASLLQYSWPKKRQLMRGHASGRRTWIAARDATLSVFSPALP